MKHELIARPIYMERIRPFIGKGMIKVISGQRRVGKSSLMMQIMNELEAEPDANILYLNTELEMFRNIHNADDLFSWLSDKLIPYANNILFVDEVQDITGFEHVFRSLLAEGECDIFCTGSNANLLSGELATYLTGRTIEIEIYSLSYDEFLVFHKLSDSDVSLRLYLTYGGLPHLSRLELTEDVAFEYLRNVYSSILLKDVVRREGIRNVAFLETLVAYLAGNTGSLFSATNISRFLKSQRIDMSAMVVINYLKALCNAFILQKVNRFDIKGLKKFEIGEKYFFQDLGIRNSIISFNFGSDIHMLMENAVYHHLRIIGYEVYVGKYDVYEIDFVGIRRNQKVYIQVCYLLADDKTLKREVEQLVKLSDNFPKYIVSLDSYINGDIQGIRHLHLRNFLRLKEL